MSTSAAQHRILASELTDATAALFRAAGLSAPAAATVAEALVEADRRGISSHGVMLVPMYVDRLRAGSVTTRDAAEIVLDAGAIVVLDAHEALGVLTGDQAMGLAVERARRTGVGVAVVRHAFHFGGAFRFVEQAAAAGCVGVAAANTRPLMPAVGGAEPVVGNNPIAFGVPRLDAAPLVLDMALSEVALGKVRLAAAAGRAIPEGWATGPDGTPTTDAEEALAGMLLPVGLHKGFGLALVVDMLTGVLSGGTFGAGVRGLYSDIAVPNDCAHFFLALDVAAFDAPGGFEERVEELLSEVVGSRRAPGVERLLLPGQLEAERRAASETGGIALDEAVHASLRATAETLGVAAFGAGAP